MEQITINVKYYKHTYLRIYDPCEVVHLSIDKKSIGICRISVQHFFERMYIENKQTIFETIFKDLLNIDKLLLKKLQEYH